MQRLFALRILWRDANRACVQPCALLHERSDEERQQAMMDALILRETIVDVMREELRTP